MHSSWDKIMDNNKYISPLYLLVCTMPELINLFMSNVHLRMVDKPLLSLRKLLVGRQLGFQHNSVCLYL